MMMEYKEWVENRKNEREKKRLEKEELKRVEREKKKMEKGDVVKEEKKYKYNRVCATLTEEQKKWLKENRIVVGTTFIRYLLDEYIAQKNAEKKDSKKTPLYFRDSQ